MGMFPIIGCPVNTDFFGLNGMVYRNGNGNEFLVIIQPETTLTTTVVGVLMGLLAALLPARYVGRLDPAQVFRR